MGTTQHKAHNHARRKINQKTKTTNKKKKKKSTATTAYVYLFITTNMYNQLCFDIECCI